MAEQYALNAIGPALLLKHFAKKLAKDRPAVFVTLSARVGSIGENRLGICNGSAPQSRRLNQIVRTAAVEIARRRPQAIVLALHPGTVQTALTAKYLGRRPAVTPAEAAANLRPPWSPHGNRRAAAGFSRGAESRSRGSRPDTLPARPIAPLTQFVTAGSQ